MALASKKTLEGFKSKIDFGTQTENIPFAQGWAINEVISRYNIPAKRWGWDGTLIGIETKNQYLFWRDKGGSLEFKGVLDKKNSLRDKKELILKEISQREDIDKEEITVTEESYNEMVRNVYNFAGIMDDEGRYISFETFKKRYDWNDFDDMNADMEDWGSRYGQKYVYVYDDKRLIFVN